MLSKGLLTFFQPDAFRLGRSSRRSFNVSSQKKRKRTKKETLFLFRGVCALGATKKVLPPPVPLLHVRVSQLMYAPNSLKFYQVLISPQLLFSELSFSAALSRASPFL